MDLRKSARRKFLKDLTRTRHMTTVSAVVLLTTFTPLLGVPDVEELRTFQRAVEGFGDARAAAFEPRRNDEAARERSAAAVIGDEPRENVGFSFGRRTYRTLTVERPARPPQDAIDAVMPLPAIEDETLIESSAGVDEQPEAPPVDSSSEPPEQVEPAVPEPAPVEAEPVPEEAD